MITTSAANQQEFDIPISSFYHEEIKRGHQSTKELAPNSHYFDVLLFPEEHDHILRILNILDWKLYSTPGEYQEEGRAVDFESWFTSFYSQDFASVLWERIRNNIELERVFTPSAMTDWNRHAHWRPVGVSPLLRFVRLTQGGALAPHYDKPFIISDKERTLQSVLIHLGDGDDVYGGRIRFLWDEQNEKNLDRRDLSEWNAFAKDDDVRYVIPIQAGAGIIFDHRVLHDSEPVHGTGQRTFMRTDIIFEEI